MSVKDRIAMANSKDKATAVSSQSAAAPVPSNSSMSVADRIAALKKNNIPSSTSGGVSGDSPSSSSSSSTGKDPVEKVSIAERIAALKKDGAAGVGVVPIVPHPGPPSHVTTSTAAHPAKVSITDSSETTTSEARFKETSSKDQSAPMNVKELGAKINLIGLVPGAPRPNFIKPLPNESKAEKQQDTTAANPEVHRTFNENGELVHVSTTIQNILQCFLYIL